MSERPAPVIFPPGFLLGSATASYQIEGAVREGGRSESIWDRFSHAPGNVLNGDTGDIACDHYNRLAEDVALMSELGMQTYRFSTAWPRLQPHGNGPLNPAGIAFYDELIDRLLDAGITPWITLYHWDLPQVLEDAGGWPARDTAYRFADYAAATHARFADRVTDWTTLNEPWCSAFLGYASGHHAPGRQNPADALAASHHLLLGHGLATEAMRAQQPDLRYGITLNLYPVYPASDAPEDVDAARRVDGICNRWFLDPVFLGHYPDDLLGDLEEYLPVGLIHDRDLSTIAAPIDFLGVNYYSTHVMRAARPGEAVEEPSANVGAGDTIKISTGRPVTAMGWEVDANGLYETMMRLHKEYPPVPLYVTENGAAYYDVVVADGVHDVERTRYLVEHFEAVRQSIDDGADVRGYMVWSLFDNFEWSFGYDRRFGIVHVDFATQERTPKDSALWLRDTIRAQD